jgi:hypothetical protein
MMISFYVTLLPPASEGDWSHGIQFTWEEAARIVYSSRGKSHAISWDGSRMEIDAQGNAIWIVEGKGGAAKRWAICREHMNRILGDAMDDSSRGIESLGE